MAIPADRDEQITRFYLATPSACATRSRTRRAAWATPSSTTHAPSPGRRCSVARTSTSAATRPTGGCTRSRCAGRGRWGAPAPSRAAHRRPERRRRGQPRTDRPRQRRRRRSSPSASSTPRMREVLGRLHWRERRELAALCPRTQLRGDRRRSPAPATPPSTAGSPAARTRCAPTARAASSAAPDWPAR